MNKWTGVTEFVAVVQSQSFTKAAASLNYSVVQVSRAVAALEERLQVKLLNRTTRRVSLTEAGQTFYSRCEPIIDLLSDAEDAVANLQHKPAGLLTVTAPVAYGETFIAPLLTAFLQAYPQISISLMLTNDLLDLRESNVDVAIRLGHLNDSTLIARRLTDRIVHTCASPAYLAQHGTPAAIKDLREHSCLVGTMDFWRFQVAGKPQTIRLSGKIRCNSGRVLLEQATQGLGIVQLPDYYVRPLIDDGHLTEVLKAHRMPAEGIWAVVTEHKKMSTKVRIFIDYLRQQLAADAPSLAGDAPPV